MSTYALALASLRGITAFYALVACVILAPAAITMALVSHFLSRDQPEEDVHDDDDDEPGHGDVDYREALTQPLYPQSHEPSPLAAELVARIPLRKCSRLRQKSAAGTAVETMTEPMCVESCVVCLVPFQEEEEVRELPPCRHTFHQPCIDRWFQTHSTCPICRRQLSIDCFQQHDTYSTGDETTRRKFPLPPPPTLGAISGTGNCIIEIVATM